MKKFLWVSAGGALVVGALWVMVLSKVPIGPFTTGDVLKHNGTDVTEPTNLQPVDASRPTLNFQWRHDIDRERPFNTYGEGVYSGSAAGEPLTPRERYVFYFKPGSGELFVRRDNLLHRLFPFLHRRCSFMDGAQQHYPIAFDANEAFDLGTGGIEGNVVLAVTPRGGNPPGKRLYRIRIEEIERKFDWP